MNYLRKFANGLCFGAGFVISGTLVCYLVFQFVLPRIENKHRELKKTDYFPPEPSQNSRYLGSLARYSGEFSKDKMKLISEGPGKIVGTAQMEKQPAIGLKLRLLFNGSMASEWAITDSRGEYLVKVPYGSYRIDGFEFDDNTLNSILPGKIDYNDQSSISDVFEVNETTIGPGLNFKFVEPLKIKNLKKVYSDTEPVIVQWNPFPGATQYRVQVWEKKTPRSFTDNQRLFPWDKEPTVSVTETELKNLGAVLKPGFFYSIEIVAEDADSMEISRTDTTHFGYDFEIKAT